MSDKETTVTAPDFTPVLSAGAHKDPQQGACLMECVSIIAGERFGDHPPCTHPVLASAARRANDLLPDAERHRLIPLISRLVGTADTRYDATQRKVLSARLAVWLARSVLHLVPDSCRAVFERTVQVAEAWVDDPSEEAREAAAYATAYTANATAYAYAYANAAAYAAAYAADYATDAAYAAAYATDAAYAAQAAAQAADATTYAADADSAATYGDLVTFLTGLLDEHDRLTGHQPRQLTGTDLHALAQAVGR